MKSYEDLAVFYYRLQHTELALKCGYDGGRSGQCTRCSQISSQHCNRFDPTTLFQGDYLRLNRKWLRKRLPRRRKSSIIIQTSGKSLSSVKETRIKGSTSWQVLADFAQVDTLVPDLQL